MAKKALYLAGGGARGAYQVGVLKAIDHILQTKKIPFDIVSGVSVGSINAAILTENADDFPEAINKLETLWQNIQCQDIFYASNYELSKTIFFNASRLFIRRKRNGYLLDTSPFQTFINKHVDFEKIQGQIDKGTLETLEIITYCYETQQTISFYEHGSPSFEDWFYPRHMSQRTSIQMEHLLGSTALPIFFPTVKIENMHLGDGSMGLISPLRGPIRFESQRILILGTRPPPLFHPMSQHPQTIGITNILGGLLNNLFLDTLDRDIEMVNRMNDISRLLSLWKKRQSPWRPVQTLHLRPSKNVGSIAYDHYQDMPTLLRFMLNRLGAKNHSGDLLSFLLFEKGFACELIDLGYHDTLGQEASLIEFFS
ncbi:MAG: patatin-like phospholipase family protein [Legionellaceae bacterium]|nr:patatin-like phospholipase family protein [Legionellaceae bacterium]